jgi:uncharacterized membrane protein SirB2
MFSTTNLKYQTKLLLLVILAGVSAMAILALRRYLQLAISDSLLLVAGSQLLLLEMGAASALFGEWVKKHRMAVLVTFIVVGTGAFWATVRQGREANASQERVINEITGGDTFCAFVADPTNNPTGLYRLSVWVYGKYPMNNVTATIQSVAEPQPSFRNVPVGNGTLLPGFHPIDFGVPVGKYVIVIWSRTGLITESLELKPATGQVAMQTIDVFSNGEKLFSIDNNGKPFVRGQR